MRRKLWWHQVSLRWRLVQTHLRCKRSHWWKAVCFLNVVVQWWSKVTVLALWIIWCTTFIIVRIEATRCTSLPCLASWRSPLWWLRWLHLLLLKFIKKCQSSLPSVLWPTILRVLISKCNIIMLQHRNRCCFSLNVATIWRISCTLCWRSIILIMVCGWIFEWYWTAWNTG